MAAARTRKSANSYMCQRDSCIAVTENRCSSHMCVQLRPSSETGSHLMFQGSGAACFVNIHCVRASQWRIYCTSPSHTELVNCELIAVRQELTVRSVWVSDWIEANLCLSLSVNDVYMWQSLRKSEISKQMKRSDTLLPPSPHQLSECARVNVSSRIRNDAANVRLFIFFEFDIFICGAYF